MFAVRKQVLGAGNEFQMELSLMPLTLCGSVFCDVGRPDVAVTSSSFLLSHFRSSIHVIGRRSFFLCMSRYTIYRSQPGMANNGRRACAVCMIDVVVPLRYTSSRTSSRRIVMTRHTSRPNGHGPQKTSLELEDLVLKATSTMEDP